MTAPKSRPQGKPAAHKRRPPQSMGRIFAMPLLLAILGLAGLILGLTGDGWRDWAACILVGLPVLAFLRDWPRRH